MPRNKKICLKCFNLIGERTRIRIIRYLQKKSSNAKQIGRHFSLTQPTISHHLKTLEKTGIIFGEKKGREKYYSLNKKYSCKNCSLFKIPFKI